MDIVLYSLLAGHLYLAVVTVYGILQEPELTSFQQYSQIGIATILPILGPIIVLSILFHLHPDSPAGRWLIWPLSILIRTRTPSSNKDADHIGSRTYDAPGGGGGGGDGGGGGGD